MAEQTKLSRALAVVAEEQHNSSVDERLVDLGLCGQTHLPSGRVLTARHSGGYVFVTPEQAETLVT